jgi:SRSO17 transposase
MDVHASPAPLPELEEFLASFQVRFRRPEGEHARERDLTGLLTELPNKNCDTMAAAVPGTSEQRLQELLTTMQWDHDDLNRQRVAKLIAEATVGKGALSVDDTGFVKKGTASVGVARQYAGTLGKVGTCQVAVTCCYSDVQACWPVAVRRDFEVCRKRRGASPGQRAARVLAALPRQQWRTIRWRQGSKGWLRKKFVALRCWRLPSQGETRMGWLVGERAARGQPEERKYYWSNLPASAAWEELVDVAHRRHAVEQFHEEAKGELGWDQYQGRLWSGFHRHALTVRLAYSFLVWQELRQRQRHPRRGRPRDPCSPSAGPISVHAASRPSGGGPLAAPPSAAVVDDHGAVHGLCSLRF